MLLVKNLSENLDCHINMNNFKTLDYSMLLVDPLLLTTVRTHSSRKNKWLETCLYHLYQNEMMPGVAANPAKQHTFLLCLQGQLFRASHSVSQQLWPNEINISITLYKYICPSTLDFHWFPLSLKLVLKKKKMKNDNFTSWRQFSVC